MEEENERKEIVEISNIFNGIKNSLDGDVNKLVEEIESYNNHYYDQTFIPGDIENDKDGIKTRKEIKKGETIFDRIYESIIRNDIIDELQQRVEMTMKCFIENMRMLHERIMNEKERLTTTNNEILDNLMMLEKRLARRSLKGIEDNEEKNKLHKSLGLCDIS